MTFKSWWQQFLGRPSPAPPAVEVAPVIPPSLEAARRNCWMPVVGDGDETVILSRFGGSPLLPSGTGWPPCGSCGKPLALFLQIASGELPPEAGHPFGQGTLQVFYCLSEEPDCQTAADADAPFSKAVLVRVLPASVGTPSPVRGEAFFTGLIVSWSVAEDFPHWHDLKDLGIQLSDEEDDGLGGAYPRAGDKLLGWPHWIQGAEYPKCRRCGGDMAYVFQIDSEDHVPHMFGDMGCGHVFRCAQHTDEMAFAWACH